MRASCSGFTAHVRDLFEFYRSGATAGPPQRAADTSRWYHRVLVALHLLACAWIAELIVVDALASVPYAVLTVAGIWLGHKAVDPVNGLVHFTIDNYFSPTAPLVGSAVKGFLGHHEQPAQITRIVFAKNVAVLVCVSLPVLVTLIALQPARSLPAAAITSLLATFFAETGFSMEAHKYAHMAERQLPAALRWLQRRQWLVPATVHAKHHARRPGHEADYASVTGRSNRYLTSSVFRRIERSVYELTRRLWGSGVEPRSWHDPAVRRAAWRERA